MGEQARGDGSSDTKLAALRQKLDTLSRMYANSSKYFPLETVVRHVEVISCMEGGDPAWVISCLQGVGVSVTRLLAVFAETPSSVPMGERRQFTVVCQDAVSTYLGELYMRQTQESNTMISSFRDIQAKLDRI